MVQYTNQPGANPEATPWNLAGTPLRLDAGLERVVRRRGEGRGYQLPDSRVATQRPLQRVERRRRLERRDGGRSRRGDVDPLARSHV